MFSPFKWYIKWRHSKGFGVHSPYAYRFVTDVLRPESYGYYSYWEIEDQLRREERTDNKFLNLIKFTIRLAVFLNSKRIVSERKSRLAEVVARCLKLERIRISKSENFSFQDNDLLILSGENANETLLRNAIGKGIPVFAIHPSHKEKEILETPIARGLLLKDSSRIILIPRPEMSYTSYPILLNL